MPTRGPHGQNGAQDYLTAAQTAKILQLAPVTIYRLAEKGQLPGAIKIGGQWRISAAVLAASFQTLRLSPEAADAILHAMPVAAER